MLCWVLCTSAFVVLLLPPDGDAACCPGLASKANVGVKVIGGVPVPYGYPKLQCGDCSKPTPCCGHGKCNIFCCKCKGGCRGGCRVRRFFEPYVGVVTVEEATSTAHDVISAADIDGDGRMSLEEAHEHLANNGLPVHRVKRSLMTMDVDNDNFLSPEEIDPVSK